LILRRLGETAWPAGLLIRHALGLGK